LINPFTIIQGFDANLAENGKVIAIASSAAGGRTTTASSLIYHYINLGINVFLFSEDKKHSDVLLEEIKNQKTENQNIGCLITFSVENLNYYYINENIRKNLRFLTGNSIVVIDNSFYEISLKFFSERPENVFSRFVLTEKTIILDESKSDIFYQTLLNKKRFLEHIRKIAYNFNIPVILTAQQIRTTNSNTDYFGTTLMYMCDVYLQSEKLTNNRKFNLKVIKSRYASAAQNVICEIDAKKLMFVTNSRILR